MQVWYEKSRYTALSRKRYKTGHIPLTGVFPGLTHVPLKDVISNDLE